MRHRYCLAFAFALITVSGANAASAQQISAPVVHGNLAVYPVRGATATGTAPLTLNSAMAQGQARIREVDGGRHTIDNLSNRHLFIQAGDMVHGGSQDQVVGASLLVPPGARGLPITMFCIERNRSAAPKGQSTDSFSGAGLIPWQTAKLTLLTQAQPTATSELLRRIGVWLGVESLTGALSRNLDTTVSSSLSPSSLPLALENLSVGTAQQSFVDALRSVPDSGADVIGAVVAINGTIYGAEVYADNALLRDMWPKLSRAFAVQAVALRGAQAVPAPTAGDVERFLRESEAGQTAGALYSVLRQPNGEWVHKSYAAKVAGATTELEAAVLKAIETNWSVPVPTVDLGLVSSRRYHEAVLLQALTASVSDREGAIAQAKRANLPVDPEQLLRDTNRFLPSLMQDTPSRNEGNPLLVILLGAVILAVTMRMFRWAPDVPQESEDALAAAARKPQPADVTLRVRRRPVKNWTMADWMGKTPETSVPVVSCNSPGGEQGSDDAKAEPKRKADLISA